MGTTWRLYHDGGLEQAVADRVAAAVEVDEQRWSRFRPSSELSYLNRCAGIPVEASAETVELLQVCDRFTRETDGLFAPLVGAAVIAWGYAVSRDERQPGTAGSPAPAPARRDPLVFDARRRIVEVPRDTLLDLGGIAKTWSCARAAALVAELSDEPSLLVEAGGDLVAARGGHVVAIEDARGPDHPSAAFVRIAEGDGICTSGWSRRHWTNADGVEAHHLIDPPHRPAGGAPPGDGDLAGAGPQRGAGEGARARSGTARRAGRGGAGGGRRRACTPRRPGPRPWSTRWDRRLPRWPSPITSARCAPSTSCSRRSASTPPTESMSRTPERVASMYQEFLAPPEFSVTTFPNEGDYDELVIVRDIAFSSLCEHHLMPFTGVAHVAYLPGRADRRAVEAGPRRRAVRAPAAGAGADDDADRRLARGRARAAGRRRRGRGRAPVHDDARRAQARRAHDHLGGARACCGATRARARSSSRSCAAPARCLARRHVTRIPSGLVTRRRTLLAIAATAIAGVVLRLHFLDVPLNTDEGGFAAIARLWRQGFTLYGNVAWVDRPQGLLVLYRLAGLADSDQALRALAIGASLLTLVAVAAAAWAVAGRAPAVAAAGLYALLSPAPHLEGFTANGELLSGALAAAGAALALWWTVRRHLALLVAAALVAGCAPLVKQSAIDGAVVVAAAAILIADRRLRNVLVVAGAGLLPAALAALHAATATAGAVGVVVRHRRLPLVHRVGRVGRSRRPSPPAARRRPASPPGPGAADRAGAARLPPRPLAAARRLARRRRARVPRRRPLPPALLDPARAGAERAGGDRPRPRGVDAPRREARVRADADPRHRLLDRGLHDA